MLASDILTAAGITHRRSKFVSPPPGTYAVWTDDVETDGPDLGGPRILTHNTTIELYEPRQDDAKAEALEAAIGRRGLFYTKQDRYWLQQEQMYQTVYNFSYIERRRS